MKKSLNNNKKPTNSLSLEKIIGNTSTNNSSISINPSTNNEIAYPAGCVVVLYDSVQNKQTFLSSGRQQAINSLSYSPDGKYLAVGEKGKDSRIVIWDLSSKKVIVELENAHKHGIGTLSFSKGSNKFLMSCGLQHDGIAALWDWKSNKLINKFKILRSSKNNEEPPKMWCVDWLEGSDESFVICGKNFISFYRVTQDNKLEETQCNLGSQFKEETFVEISYCKDISHVVTNQGKICTINNNKKSIERWVDFKARIWALSMCEKYFVVGGDDGWIRVFEPKTLQYVASLPRPHSLGSENEPSKLSSTKPLYPNVSSCKISADYSKVFSFYSDKSFFVFDITNLKKVIKQRTFLAHSGSILDMDVVSTKNTNKKFSGSTFVTCSSDSTVRIWDMKEQQVNKEEESTSQQQQQQDLLRVLHINNDFSSMKPTGNGEEVSGEKGQRCLKLNDNCSEIATGDRDGVLRVFNCETFEQTFEKDAHNSEILSIDFSHGNESSKTQYLASGSRDRTIQLFSTPNQTNTEYKLVESISDHTSSINAVKFVKDEKILSCGADKSLIFRSLSDSNKTTSVQRENLKLTSTTLYDMSIDPLNKYVITAGTEKQLNIYSVTSGKQVRSRTLSSNNKNETSDGAVIKVQLDPSGIYVISITNKKELGLYDFYSGECISQIPESHSEGITGAKFTSDCKRIVSVSSDSCIFVWKLHESLTKEMISVLSSKTQNEVSVMNMIPNTKKEPVIPTTSSLPVPTFPSININNSGEGLSCWGIPESDNSRESIGPSGVWKTDPHVFSNFKLFSDKDEDQIFFDMNEQRRYTVEPSDHQNFFSNDDKMKEELERERDELLKQEKLLEEQLQQKKIKEQKEREQKEQTEKEQREKEEKEEKEEREREELQKEKLRRQEKEKEEKIKQEKEEKEREEQEKLRRKEEKQKQKEEKIKQEKEKEKDKEVKQKKRCSTTPKSSLSESNNNNMKMPLSPRRDFSSSTSSSKNRLSEVSNIPNKSSQRTSLTSSKSSSSVKKSPLDNINQLLSLFETCSEDFQEMNEDSPFYHQYLSAFQKISKSSSDLIPTESTPTNISIDKENMCNKNVVVTSSPHKFKSPMKQNQKDIDFNLLKDSSVFKNALDKYSEILFQMVSLKMESKSN